MPSRVNVAYKKGALLLVSIILLVPLNSDAASSVFILSGKYNLSQMYGLQMTKTVIWKQTMILEDYLCQVDCGNLQR